MNKLGLKCCKHALNQFCLIEDYIFKRLLLEFDQTFQSFMQIFFCYIVNHE
jgi:hypothetical protein